MSSTKWLQLDSIQNTITDICKTPYIKLLTHILLDSIYKYNNNENALDTVTSIIIKGIENLLFEQMHPNTNEKTKQKNKE